ncbi:hypothetical protein TraAM80_04421 [Trypanosoma rangeli]|uniref:DUF7163 domain-containing protein n=1 Tax=Trypanosoma rangeli TaxID=5698 RepID=A0A3R7L1B4_TRYRA|nr:uncharacterized protein TraAM80_04421 [Trypanosoma rangeli]RNF05594.1 hypothetical protein TraAM80_04421 [Trypanosoma rangeli]|eukprot:RNF05594.1 hypothetical protein TraAM80_04421 [Trypanosoma rangeli]
MSSVSVVFDLRYTDLELFESARNAFTTAVGEMLALSRAAVFVRGEQWPRVEVFAANGSRLLPVWDAARDTNVMADAMRILSALTPVRSPARDTNQCVVDSLQQLLYFTAHPTTDSLRSLFFFTTFTTISDFSRLVHSAKILAIPFMEHAWVSLHLDATAMTTTSLALTPAIRSIRCPIAPLVIRSVIQQSLAAFLQLQRHVPVSLRFGRYTVPCAARRSFFALPTRCCTAEDFDMTREGGTGESNGDSAIMLLTGRHVCISHFERERWVTQEVALTAEGVVSSDAVSEEALYGDGWTLCPKDSGQGERHPEEWMYHLSNELKGDVLILTTQQPHLDPPHQLALPVSTFVGFFLRPTQLYLRALIPPELLCEQLESVGACATRYRHDAALSDELKKTMNTLRTDSAVLRLRRPAGVCRTLVQLQRSQQFTLQLGKSQGAVKRGAAQPLHALHR